MIFPEMIADELARNFVVVVLAVLLVLSLFLAISAVILRQVHARDEAYRLRKKEELYPLILSYLDMNPDSGSGNEVEVEDLEGEIQSRLVDKRDFEVLEDLAIEIMYNISGVEKLRLRRLLLIETLFDYRYKQLVSRRVENLIQACLYFANVINQRPDVLDLLFPLLDHKSILVLHTAGSAIFSSEDSAIRGKALAIICKRTGISEMALLELIYKFHNKEMDQMDLEVAQLTRIISDETTSDINRSVIIKSIADIGYVTMADFLFDLISPRDDSDSSAITISLIHSMGRFEYTGAAGLLAENFAGSDHIGIRETLADTLGKLGRIESIPVLVNLTSDEDYGVRIRAVYALAAMGEPGYDVLRNLQDSEGEIQRIATNIIDQLETGKVVEI